MKAPDKLTKLYYSIGEVADMFHVSSSLLRYWESEFPGLNIKKSRKGDRQFQIKDIEQIAQIFTLLKERGFTIEGAKKELKRKPKQQSTGIKSKDDKRKLVDKLNSIRKGLNQLRDSI